jgi:hypothetical protein
MPANSNGPNISAKKRKEKAKIRNQRSLATISNFFKLACCKNSFHQLQAVSNRALLEL